MQEKDNETFVRLARGMILGGYLCIIDSKEKNVGQEI
jgi:hypothetical protein